MDDADDDKKCKAFPNLMRRYEQNIANQHVLDFLVAVRTATQQQDRSISRHDIRNSADRVHLHSARAFPGHGQHCRSNQRAPEPGSAPGNCATSTSFAPVDAATFSAILRL